DAAAAEDLRDSELEQSRAEAGNREAAGEDAEADEKGIEDATMVGQWVNLAVADGGHRGEGHVEAVEPTPTLDEMEAGGTAKNNEANEDDDEVDAMEYVHGATGRDASWGGRDELSRRPDMRQRVTRRAKKRSGRAAY